MKYKKNDLSYLEAHSSLYLYLIASSGLIEDARRAGKIPVTNPTIAEKKVIKPKKVPGKAKSATAEPP